MKIFYLIQEQKARYCLTTWRKLDVDPGKISKIVISHEHWDHYGGLKALAPLVDDIELYQLEKENPGGNMNLVTVKESREIIDGVYTTGRLNGTPVDEQSLVLKAKKYWYVLAGCSHSGLKKSLVPQGSMVM
jgi:7,8-dihydropterin-6-yl-methyl-4-(beta-D-ribofuranosyl)aminobenzene 5'-phosphate synthase